MKTLSRFFFFFLLLVVLTIGTIEIIGWQIGLTDPPLSMFDADMEYRYTPNQDCMLMGRRFVINKYSQRSAPLREKKPGDLRVLVIGDSIPSGGTSVDQADLATSMLERNLQQKTGRPTQVLNASAGSWGPPNELAYVKKFGTFDADVFVVIFSTQDSDDRMTFAPTVGVNSSYPDKRPLSTTWMLYDRYIPRFFAILRAQQIGTEPPPKVDSEVMGNITELVQLLKATGKPVIVVLHPQRDELNLTTDLQAWTTIRTAAEKGGAIIADSRPKYKEAIQNGMDFYRDVIHPNPAGQHVLGEVMEEAILPVITKGHE